MAQETSTDPQQLLARIEEYNTAYYNGEPLVPDVVYDRLVSKYTELTGITPTTGVLPAADKIRVELPVYMGGTNKYKYSDDPRILQRFAAGTDRFLVTEKLDGTAALVEIPPRGPVRAYTRGDYSTGFEISDLLKIIKPQWKRFDSTVFIRGELIMPRRIFQEKYSSDFTNSRSLVNGVVNAKTRDRDTVKDIHFVAFEILSEPRGTFSEQIQLLDSHGIRTPCFASLTAGTLTLEHLQREYTYMAQYSDYTLDGLVVYKDDFPVELCNDRNPSFSIAYKPPTETVRVTVTEIEWTVSRYNKLKPVAVFPVVVLAGANVIHATAHNARFVHSNMLGPGAVIEITKSNEVIPYIVRVIEPVDTAAAPSVNYRWCPNRVDYLLIGEDPVVLVKQIVHFLKSCGVKGISERTVEKIVNTGVKDILEFLQVSDETLSSLEGFQARKITNFHSSLSVLVSGVELANVMAGSPLFPHGFGKRKFAAITAAIPQILELAENPEILQNRLGQVRGISQESAILISGRIPPFVRFVSAATESGVLNISLPPEPVKPRSGLKELGSIVFSGFRDSSLETLIAEHGGTVTSSVTKNTSKVIVKDLEKITSKTRRAVELNIPIVLKADFVAEL